MHVLNMEQKKLKNKYIKKQENQQINKRKRRVNKKSIYKLFLSLLLKKGKMPICQRIVVQTYLDVFKKTHFSMFQITKYLLEIGGLIMEIRRKRRGKIMHIVPFPAGSHRRKYLTLKNFIVSILKDTKKEKTYKKMSNEIMKRILRGSTAAKTNAMRIYTKALRYSSNAHYRWN